jgi:hypothetical protein
VPAPSGRSTTLHHAAHFGCIGAAVPLLIGGAYQSIADNIGSTRATDNKGYAVPPTAKRRPHADRPDRSVQANASQTYCELGSMSTQPHVGRGVAVRTADSGDGRGGVPLVRMVVPVLVPTIRRLWQSYSIVCSACVHSAGSADRVWAHLPP